MNRYARKHANRDEAITQASAMHEEVGEHFDLHYSSVSHIVNKQREAREK